MINYKERNHRREEGRREEERRRFLPFISFLISSDRFLRKISSIRRSINDSRSGYRSSISLFVEFEKKEKILEVDDVLKDLKNS